MNHYSDIAQEFDTYYDSLKELLADHDSAFMVFMDGDELITGEIHFSEEHDLPVFVDDNGEDFMSPADAEHHYGFRYTDVWYFADDEERDDFLESLENSLA